jgi:hypothetical protein
MRSSAAPFGYDPDGSPRTIAVLLNDTHEGVVVWHSPQEYVRLWAGVDRASAQALAEPLDRARDTD